MKKSIISFLFVVCGLTMLAQTVNPMEQQTIVNKVVEEEPIAENNQQVISNFFRHNWFILADVGVNAFWGDYTVGNLSTRLTPQFNVGVGKWFVPGFGAKVQFMDSSPKSTRAWKLSTPVKAKLTTMETEIHIGKKKSIGWTSILT